MKPGDKVVCIKKNGWVNAFLGTPTKGPGYHETVTIDHINDIDGHVALVLKEYKYVPEMECMAIGLPPGAMARFPIKYFKEMDDILDEISIEELEEVSMEEIEEVLQGDLVPAEI